MEVCANLNGTLFFIDRNKIGDPVCVCNGVYGFGKVEGALILENGGNIRPSFNVILNNGWV